MAHSKIRAYLALALLVSSLSCASARASTFATSWIGEIGFGAGFSLASGAALGATPYLFSYFGCLGSSLSGAACPGPSTPLVDGMYTTGSVLGAGAGVSLFGWLAGDRSNAWLTLLGAAIGTFGGLGIQSLVLKSDYFFQNPIYDSAAPPVNWAAVAIVHLSAGLGATIFYNIGARRPSRHAANSAPSDSLLGYSPGGWNLNVPLPKLKTIVVSSGARVVEGASLGLVHARF